MLNYDTYGEPTDKPPLLIAHGLFGSARNWGVIARRLADSRQVVAVDMRNHGNSPWFDSHSYPDLAGDLAEVIDGFGGEMDVLGHSMGGKAAMVLALEHGEKLRRVVIADIAPVAYGHTQDHLISAMKSVPASVANRAEADAALAASVDTPELRSFLLQSLDLKAHRWRLNLDVLHRFMPQIVGFPKISGSHSGPVFFLTGADSDYVRPDHRGPIKQLFPGARFAKIPGVGHWLHAEKPREFEAAVRAFLDG